MHIECNKEALINAINTVGRVTSKRSTMPILNCILLSADRDGLKLLANNLELSIETDNIEADIYEKGSVALDLNLFSNIVRNMPTDFVTIKLDSNNICQIKSGKSNFKLNGLPGEQFPMPPEIKDTDEPIEVSGAAFKNSIRQTIFAAAVDEGKPILMGEYIKIEDGYMHIVAIDGFRVSWRKIKTDYRNFIDMIVPVQTLNEVSRLISESSDDNIKIYHSQKNVLFRLKNCTVVSSLIEGDYMSYEKLFITSPTTTVTAETQDMLRALERATIICNDNKKPSVNIDISTDNVNINSQAELGNTSEDIQVKTEGDDLSISFNARFLVDVFKNVEEEYIKITFNTNKSPCIITGVTNNDFKYLVLPVNRR